MSWVPIPRYRTYAGWYVTLSCGHSGLLDPGSGVHLASYLCPDCPGVHELARAVRLPPTWRDRT